MFTFGRKRSVITDLRQDGNDANCICWVRSQKKLTTSLFQLEVSLEGPERKWHLNNVWIVQAKVDLQAQA